LIRAAHAIALVALAAMLAPGSEAGAHGRSFSYSRWSIDGTRVTAKIKVSALDASAVPEAVNPEGIVRHVSAGVAAESDGRRCAAGPTRPVGAARGWQAFEIAFECEPGNGLAVHVDALFDAIAGHVHLARIETSDGRSFERVITATDRRWQIDLAPAGAGAGAGGHGADLWRYVVLGVEHIASGYDHLAFVIALVLLAGSLAEVAVLASAFTVAHSITLALAVLGIARPEARVVEALIGFSIALVAVENTWLLSGRRRIVPVFVSLAVGALAAAAAMGYGAVPATALVGLALFTACHFGLMRISARPQRLRAAVAFGFGLVHGFGFAGVLAEITDDPSRLVRALLGFNVGVELGQLAVLALVWPLLLVAARVAEGRPHRLIAEVGSAAICGLGTFWFLVRAFG
jgi:hypothetical protein